MSAARDLRGRDGVTPDLTQSRKSRGVIQRAVRCAPRSCAGSSALAQQGHRHLHHTVGAHGSAFIVRSNPTGAGNSPAVIRRFTPFCIGRQALARVIVGEDEGVGPSKPSLANWQRSNVCAPHCAGHPPRSRRERGAGPRSRGCRDGMAWAEEQSQSSSSPAPGFGGSHTWGRSRGRYGRSGCSLLGSPCGRVLRCKRSSVTRPGCRPETPLGLLRDLGENRVSLRSCPGLSQNTSAGSWGHDGCQGVPAVARGDQHRVDVVAGEHIADHGVAQSLLP